jgi:1-acyl-sn-glycerol-3-phosphate acyltransferase
MTEWQLRPARDHGLTLQQRLRSSGREPGLGGHLLGLFWRGLMRGYLRAVHRLEVTGREHLPRPPFVLVANHSSHLDALTLAAALPHRLARRAFALAAGDTFFTTLPGAAFAAYAINALPVWRKDTTEADIDLWRARLLEDGAVLILFPEGTRSRTGAMARFRPGIGTLVAGHPIPVVPCFLAGAHAAWPAERRLPRPGRLHLTIGPALHFTDAATDRASTIAVAAACEAAVRALMPVSP